MKKPQTRIKVSLDRHGEEIYYPQVKRFGLWWNLIEWKEYSCCYTAVLVFAKKKIDEYIYKYNAKKIYPKVITYPED